MTTESGRAGPPAAWTLELHPAEVARRWADAVQSGEFDAAIDLYADAAVIHVGCELRAGRFGAQQTLQLAPYRKNAGGRATIFGGAEEFLVVWSDLPLELATRLRIRRGRIVEHWEAGVERR